VVFLKSSGIKAVRTSVRSVHVEGRHELNPGARAQLGVSRTDRRVFAIFTFGFMRSSASSNPHRGCHVLNTSENLPD
jgi:hypothetical protein